MSNNQYPTVLFEVSFVRSRKRSINFIIKASLVCVYFIFSRPLTSSNLTLGPPGSGCANHPVSFRLSFPYFKLMPLKILNSFNFKLFGEFASHAAKKQYIIKAIFIAESGWLWLSLAVFEITTLSHLDSVKKWHCLKLFFLFWYQIVLMFASFPYYRYFLYIKISFSLIRIMAPIG